MYSEVNKSEIFENFFEFHVKNQYMFWKEIKQVFFFFYLYIIDIMIFRRNFHNKKYRYF